MNSNIGNRAVRIGLGVGSFLPLIAIAELTYFMFGPPSDLFESGSEAGIAWFWLSWALGGVAGLMGLVITIYYALIIARSDASQSDREFWAKSLILLSPVMCPIFWYRVIWKGQSVSEATVRA